MQNSIIKKYGYIWVTLLLFLGSLVGHWTFAWYEFVAEQEEHSQKIMVTDYFNKTMRGTLENWQSEFLQLIWQVLGLTILWSVGSPQSKEGEERKEKKLDLILERIDPKNYKKLIDHLEKKYPKK
jgi:hypothetical protein